MQNNKKSLLFVHIAIALFGSSSLFGKLINQPAFVIVSGRVLFSVILMFIIFKLRKISLSLGDRTNYLKVVLLGIILAVHWFFFYHAIQISTVTIVLLTFSTCPIFATFIEPMVFREEKLEKINVIIACVAFFGIIIVVPKLDVGSSMLQGFIEGILSGLTFALVSVLERKYVKEFKGVVISFYEQLVVFIVLLPLCIAVGLNPVSKSDIFYILLFATVFTLVSRYFYINGLKGVSAQTAGVISCLEPVYGIILAFIILGEVPTVKEIIGGLIIMGAAVYSSMRAVKKA